MLKIVNISILAALIAASAAGFLWGRHYQRQRYEELCADLGGTIRSEELSLCVVEEEPRHALEAAPCSNVIGSWVEPVPGRPDQRQGFILYGDGSARSINMATLLYKGWKISGKNITLSYESVGNHVRFESSDEYEYEMPDKDRLILKKDDWRLEYSRLGSS
jgi:hypothetical protein